MKRRREIFSIDICKEMKNGKTIGYDEGIERANEKHIHKNNGQRKKQMITKFFLKKTERKMRYANW